MKTDHYDTTWARAWLPPLMTAMVDAQFTDPPAGRADTAPAAWPLGNPYLFEPETVAGAARPSHRALVVLLRGCFAVRHFRTQHST